MKNILIFFGGRSCEHDISVLTGVMACNSLRGSEYTPVPIYVTRSGEFTTGDDLFDLSFYREEKRRKSTAVALIPSDKSLYFVKKNKIKKAFPVYAALNCMHGLNGEDGSLAGLLQLSGIPVSSPKMFQSSFSMDKYFTKIVLGGIGVRTLPFVEIKREDYIRDKQKTVGRTVEKLSFPIIVKPANLGSSIGIGIANDEKSLLSAFENAFRFDGKVIVEKALDGFREINCACYSKGGRAVVSECEEPIVSGGMLSFDDKYVSDTKKVFPADIGKEISDKIKEITLKIYSLLDFDGVVRMDYLLQGNEIFLNEINSVPGSLAYYLFCSSTEDLPAFIGDLIENCVGENVGFNANEFEFHHKDVIFGNGTKTVK